MPRARPETTTTPARPSSRASSTRDRPCRTPSTRARRRSRRTAGRAASSDAAPRTNRPGGGSWIERSRAGKAGSTARDPADARRREPRDGTPPRRSAARKRANRAERGSSSRCAPVAAANTATASSLIARSSARRTVRERLGHVLGLDLLGARERGDRRARPARPARDRARRAAAARRRASAARRRRRRAPARARAAAHGRRAPARGRGASLAGRPGELGPRGRGTASDEIEAVEQRAREPLAVPLDALRRCTRTRAAGSPRAPHGQRFMSRRAGSAPGRRARPPTRATATTPSSSGWRSASSTGALELGQLVEEEHAAMREARLARAAAPRRRRRSPAAEAE